MMLTICLASLVRAFDFAPADPAARRPTVKEAHATSIPKFVEWQIDGIHVAVRARDSPPRVGGEATPAERPSTNGDGCPRSRL